MAGGSGWTLALLWLAVGGGAPNPPTKAEAARVAERQSSGDPAILAGRWRVVHVAVGDGVQALIRDDPTYMGRTLTIGAEAIGWDEVTDPGFADRCDGPVTARQEGAAAQAYQRDYAMRLARLGVSAPDPHAVECDAGQWGPEAAGGAILFPVDRRHIAMSWHDGALLLLERR